jgi:ABC-type phosphate transport system substrate-binding protein
MMLVPRFRAVQRFLLALALATAVFSAAAADDRPVVIVNARVDEQAIPLVNVRTIFSMRLSYWKNGLPVRVFVLADDHPTHVQFSKQVLGIYPYQLRWAWDRLVFSGTGQAPTTVSDEEEMKRRVSSTPGAIGYLSRSKVDETVKIATVE